MKATEASNCDVEQVNEGNNQTNRINQINTYSMKRKLKITFRDKQSQQGVFRLANADGTELMSRNIKTAPGVNAINLALKSYKGEMIINVETANCLWQKRVLIK